jgi:hypothetical protein
LLEAQRATQLQTPWRHSCTMSRFVHWDWWLCCVIRCRVQAAIQHAPMRIELSCQKHNVGTVGTPAWQQEAAEVGRQEPELLDPVADLKVNAFDLVGDIRRQQRLLAHRAAMPAHWCAAASPSPACRTLGVLPLLVSMRGLTGVNDSNRNGS